MDIERLPPIEQHPSQIRQRPVQKAQSQKKHCKNINYFLPKIDIMSTFG
jgi:hypothetical protein